MSQASEDGTLRRMWRDSSLLVRRWPERRPVVLAAAALAFAAVAAAVVAAGDPALGVLSVLPVMLAALELGLVGGLVAAAGATALVLASGAVLLAVAPLAVAVVAGRFSDRMRARPRARAAAARLRAGARRARGRTTGCRGSSPPRRSARRA